MSQRRRACVTHQSYFFKHNLHHFIKSPDRSKSENNQVYNNKVGHANLIYERWETHQIKSIFSTRLGISYQTRYHANGSSEHFKRQKKPMACTRVFNIGKPNVSLSIDDKLSAARKHNFLFTPSQFIYKSIHHLLYRANETIPNPTHYNYLVPFFQLKPKTLSTLQKSLIDSIEEIGQGVDLSPDTSTRPNVEYLSYKE
ncbi:hypothetical protein GLOIN_2v1764040 [Rhizophagus irregularis DAOM 181602=DAOM 197198]|uniref:DUF8211 domain-containing protein n=1 Tax=Rhizophagus irregularis (strain DAOM 181602 / DAOM 197198 / MUCL 43194) TaxID=747089 RepID=A0A2P4QT18_RHIID|nr:hypothetical protein GLOIN_2v1764040 [Rhizophagus irregularis DAOM 181602=DAOM 197198]POG80791.1 hypothetical protein GLOIN_2v1764040 [Rhizophagus irregularis DAOM 181602=DAOM 197198]GET58892.1 hypothetical protein GLOIN_2v1764040 [Rhizophagus irregularis DAOM 181602=DAOM 197198]|eukprot:XP_025187657.1 hypothetical protein GLOIN_2v1764040 [Rhizophagus irregularis DAOM 181602=DAOM 197198]